MTAPKRAPYAGTGCLRSLDEGLNIKRRVIESLRPTLLDNVGLIAALRWLVDESVRRAGLACEEEYAEPLPDLSPDANIAVFRVVQECLINVMKHAQAKSVRLAVASDEQRLAVTIRDDGIGIDEQRADVPQSHGLLGIRHRIEALGGELRIGRPAAGAGTEVSFTPAVVASPAGRQWRVIPPAGRAVRLAIAAALLSLAGCDEAATPAPAPARAAPLRRR